MADNRPQIKNLGGPTVNPNQKGGYGSDTHDFDNENPKADISNTEWGLVVSALGIIDLVQWGITFIPIAGQIINGISNVGIGLAFGLYLQLRGQSFVNPKRVWGFVGGFFGEEATAGIAPAWFFIGLHNYFLYKAEQNIDKIPGGTLAKGALQKVGGGK